MKRRAPATERNRTFILDVLSKVLAGRERALEIASGTGEHAVFFAQSLPSVVWQPTDLDDVSIGSIDAWRADSGLQNLLPARRLDVCEADWGVSNIDAIVCINMIHIAPWAVTRALFKGAAKLLPPGAPVYLYGPYRFPDEPLAPSNQSFDASLRQRDSTWGIRDIDEVTTVAREEGFERVQVTAMPANNHSVVFNRAG
jgi:hypothetical protein